MTVITVRNKVNEVTNDYTQDSIKLRLCTACCSLHDAADGGGVGHPVHADVEVSAVAGVLALPAVRGHVLAAGVVLAEEHFIAHGARVAHLAVRVLLPGGCTSYFHIIMRIIQLS